MITTSSLEALKAKIDIVDVISSCMELKKNGGNFKAPCPFHSEKTASFVVSPRKQIFHCFGCGAGGDAIKFVEEYKKLTFVEAAEDIANDLNFKLEHDNTGTVEKDYSRVMEHINNYYVERLDSPTGEYLQGRGITLESIKTFEIGFTTSSKEQMASFSAQFFNVQDAIECGVLAVDDSGKTYARLVNRISFPIRNHTGKLIGFGGRITKGEGAKYINSPQTKLFDKSRNLYGYNIAKPFIYEKGTFVITEGYFDVIMLHQAGVKTAVATMGTALTEQHCVLIKKVGAKALLCYDGDKAGIAAAFKASKLLSAHGIFGGVVLFPEGKDPADMVADGSAEELHFIMKQNTPLIKFALSHIAGAYNINVPQQKEEALREVQLFLQTLSPVIQDEYKPYIAKILQINQAHIATRQTRSSPAVILDHINIAEMNIIKTASESEAKLSIVLDCIDADVFEFHSKEFAMLMQGDKQLQGLLLREELSVYTDEELLNQLKTMLITYNNKKLQAIIHSSESFERKAFEIKKIKGIIHTLMRDVRVSA
ncbi:MAG: DNA primase [Sulfurimonas sp.]|uniref:DNA primase n=1 Tax=Sulfurimonas sp. TaxID=2022749 RepID=UPI0028CE9AEB|nr:DNA primase [Sulfurimonas sp.]MDT8339320.1 DNA primase [Sulfurimonas sp.]